MRSRYLLALLTGLTVMLMLGEARANWLGNIRIEEPTHSYLANGTKLWATFDYNITDPAGARFRVYPEYGGAVVSGYSWSGSVVYPMGTGTASNWFAFWSGSHVVDHYRIEMISADWTTVLLSISVPVFLTIGDHGIAHLAPSHTSPSVLRNGDAFIISFDYATAEAGGVLIFARPFHDGVLESGYVASGSELLPYPSGSASQSFRFVAGEHQVDQVRFQMWNADQTVLLLQFFTPVDLAWRDHGLANFALTPPSPECLGSGQSVTIEFDYATSATTGVYIWAFAADAPDHAMPGQVYAGSALLLAQTGQLSRFFNIPLSVGEQEVPWVLVRMVDAAMSTVLVSANLPVAYHWGPHAIRNIAYAPRPPAVLDDGEYIDVTFDYVTTEASGARIFVSPLTDGAWSPHFAVSPSPLYPVVSGSGSAYFTILSGQVVVDQVRHWMTNADQSALLLEFERDVQFFFGGPGFVTHAPEPLALPAPPAVLGAACPNPFNPVTRIPVTLREAAPARLRLYDARGRLVRELADGLLPAGRTEIALRADELASGAYFCVLESCGMRQTQRVMLVK